MTTENSQAKQLSELTFWATRFILNGEQPLPGRQSAERYCSHLAIDLDTFADRIVVDVGCGPVGSLDQFRARLKFGVDVLSRSYAALGIQAHDMVYLAAPAENLPFIDSFVDDVISLNALDHVGNFEAAVSEISRILKPGGRVFLGFNLRHMPTLQEPQFLTQERIVRVLTEHFTIDQSFINPLPEPWRQDAPGGVLVIHATHLGSRSIYAEAGTQLIRRLKTSGGVALEELDLEYIRAHGAPPEIQAERAAANAFIEHFRRLPGWEKRLLQSVGLGVFRNPRLLSNKGIWSISRRAVLSLLGFKSQRA